MPIIYKLGRGVNARENQKHKKVVISRKEGKKEGGMGKGNAAFYHNLFDTA